MAADVIQSLAALRGSENVKSGLEPVREAVGDFDRFMQLVVCGKRAVVGGFGALKSEIGMELHHRVARLNGFVRIHLDFVVSLRVSGQRQDRANKQIECDPECNPQSHIPFP